MRERESVLRLRERRWLDGASFDTERGSTSREGEPSLDKKSIPVQSPVSLGEELQWWPDKVTSNLKNRNTNLRYDIASGASIYSISFDHLDMYLTLDCPLVANSIHWTFREIYRDLLIFFPGWCEVCEHRSHVLRAGGCQLQRRTLSVEVERT